jgi:hypothetical protein
MRATPRVNEDVGEGELGRDDLDKMIASMGSDQRATEGIRQQAMGKLQLRVKNRSIRGERYEVAH